MIFKNIFQANDIHAQMFCTLVIFTQMHANKNLIQLAIKSIHLEPAMLPKDRCEPNNFARN